MIGKVFLFILGACVGSFLNVCIYRLPKEKSIITPRSFCRQCNVPIKWYDNIPLLSYIFLKGKCRSCRERISFRYPFVEFITGLLFLVLYIKLGLSLSFAKFAFFFCLLIIISFIDIDYHALPVYLCVVGISVGLGFSLLPSLELLKRGTVNLTTLPIVRAFRGLIFGFGFTYLFKFFGDVFIDFYLKLRRKESIEGERESLGLGDVDFMGMVGVFLGTKAVIFTFFLAPFFALGYSIFALIFKRSHLIPYLPYLSLATVTIFFWGDKILSFIF